MGVIADKVETMIRSGCKGREIIDAIRAMEDKEDNMAFIGKVVRLNTKDFDRWRKGYSAISDFVAELSKADSFYAEHPPKDGKWFFPVSRWLSNAHNEALKARNVDAHIYRGVI